MATTTQRYTVSPDVLHQQMNDEVVLLHLGSSHYYGLDEVGARFWTLLEENGDPDAAIPILLAEYEIDEESLRADLQQLLSELTAAALLLPAE